MNVPAASPDHVVDRLRWRYATKSFDPSRTIAAGTWDALEESLVLTPSSFGLQPWRFVVLTDRAGREPLVAHAWGQRQVADSSHFVVFCIRRDIGEADIARHVARVSEVRGTPPEKLEGFRTMMLESLVDGPYRAVINEWATRQVYIALGTFMTVAAMLGVDTCPMEGFDSARFDELLGLAGQGLSSVVCCAAGYRAADDRDASLAKVRFPRGEVIERR